MTKQERNLLATAQKRYPLLEVDRGIINGLDQIQAQELYIDRQARSPGRAFQGAGEVSKELQERLGVDSRAGAHHGRRGHRVVRVEAAAAEA